MNNSKKRVFTAEFKHESALLVLQQNYTISEAADAMGVGQSTMAKWVAQVRKELGGVTPQGRAITPEQQRIKELEKRIKRVELENSILKKATALLISDSLNNLN